MISFLDQLVSAPRKTLVVTFIFGFLAGMVVSLGYVSNVNASIVRYEHSPFSFKVARRAAYLKDARERIPERSHPGQTVGGQRGVDSKLGKLAPRLRGFVPTQNKLLQNNTSFTHGEAVDCEGLDFDEATVLNRIEYVSSAVLNCVRQRLAEEKARRLKDVGPVE